jgi:hypothetical protein
MNATLAARLPLEMLHGIRHVDFGAVDPSFGERGVQQFSGRADKRFALDVFLIPRYLTDEHDLGGGLPFSEYRLRGIFPQIAGPAISSRCLQTFERRVLWDQSIRRSRLFFHELLDAQRPVRRA